MDKRFNDVVLRADKAKPNTHCNPLINFQVGFHCVQPNLRVYIGELYVKIVEAVVAQSYRRLG